MAVRSAASIGGGSTRMQWSLTVRSKPLKSSCLSCEKKDHCWMPGAIVFIFDSVSGIDETGNGTLNLTGDFFENTGIFREIENILFADREKLALAALGERDQKHAPAGRDRNDGLHRWINALDHLDELFLPFVEFFHQSVPPVFPPVASSFSTSALIASAAPISIVPTRC